MNGVSVIIPIYNVEKYIKHCLQSVVTSMKDLSNIQIILVNDGSKDQSGEIAKEFAKEYSNFCYVTKENGGLSDARNYGLKYVKYNYIAFIDSDDFIAEDYFSEVLNALQTSPDMIVFDWMDVIENESKSIVKGIDFPNSLWTVQPSAWNKIYKAAFFDDVKFPKGKIYEDVGTIYKLLYKVKDFIYINKPLYMYRKNREGSILTTISPKINDIYEVLDETYSFYKDKDMITEEIKDGLCYQYVKLLMWSNMYRQLKFYKFNFNGFFIKMKETRRLIVDKFPNWKENHLLLENSDYFINRLGERYIHSIDRLGKNIFSTMITILYLIKKNIKRS
ncbi:glycosyltransferase family 2 protein [Priestia megaterium]|uniref:glycosyltransferase family 2 protein n=1 Tax=Priestia megaterium TaxID=1404 RepID=UPI0027313C68|nr:glycosyltransferase family 2 protein [Priestia megaterium]MDP1443100.1 glycosyltransferase family 2 protein [Priestia megaterium]MDP1472234.1 glycosyltransferase family 2 protein [Priestia megaterium]MED4268337.1 glycosyltransferase family 2 protein [Priestia megaterium]MED4279916.1 glycosyltransferase family 2 protein [Priestia megaterium]MED4319268.1 glycosyltransferase family 2 protein [Priestia megaterium]